MELQVLLMVREERKAGSEMVNVVHRDPTELENHSEVFLLGAAEGKCTFSCI